MVKKLVSKRESTNEFETDSLPKEYDPEQVRKGVKILLENLRTLKHSARRNPLLDDGEYVLILVSCIKIPSLTKKTYRCYLPHGFLKDTSEVCLFVRNLSGNNDREYENTVRHFKNLLSEANVKSVHEVISINQFKQEYKTYEMKRRLADRFEFFLGDSRVNDWLNGTVGKQFHRCKKIPNPVKLDSKNLKETVDNALHKTFMIVTGKGDNFSAKIGNTSQSLQQLCENIDAFVKYLMVNFPGKWENIKSLHIRTTNSVGIPIYWTFANPNAVRVPKVEPRPETRVRPVDEGELSTLPDGQTVIVHPDGTVEIKKQKIKNKSKDLSDMVEDDSDDEEAADMDEDVMSDSKEDVAIKDLVATSESEEEDNEVDAAEEAYLHELTMEKNEKSNKRKKGDEEKPVLPTKMQKKMEEKESMVSKDKGKTVKGVEVPPLVKTVKKRKSVPLSKQWNIEDLSDKSIEVNNSRTKMHVNSQNQDKHSNAKNVSEPRGIVKTKAIVKSLDEVSKKKSADISSGDALSNKRKKSKLEKVKKESNL